MQLSRFFIALIVAGSISLPANVLASEATQTVTFSPEVEAASVDQTEDEILFTTQSEGADAETEEEVIFEPESTEAIVWPDVDSYFAAFVSQNAYPRLTADQSYRFSVTVRNIGATPWADDLVFLGTNRPQDRVPSFLRDDVVDGNLSGWVSENRVEMLFDDETGLPVGDTDENGVIDHDETATFDFWMSVPETMEDGVYKEYFNLVAEDITWFDDLGIYWDVTVDNAPHARFVDQNPYPETLFAGDSYAFWVRFENTGLIPWQDAGDNPVHLGTDRPMDRIPGFLREAPAGEASGWTDPNGNRVMLERDQTTDELIGDENGNDQIDQGEIARFSFWYTVPETMETGNYVEYFRPVMDNRDHGWMEDYGVFWTNVVNNIAPRPINVIATSKVNQLTIAWTPSAEATSYKVRYKAVGGDVFTLLDVPGSLTFATIDVAGGQDYEVGVASVDAEGISPFVPQVLHVESPAEAQARIAAEAAREAEQERIVEERRQAEKAAEEEPVVTGPPGVEGEETRDWRQFWLTLLIILGAAGLATAGYYGYEWWAESRRSRPTTRVTRPEPLRREPPKRDETPKPPAPPTSSRW